MRYNKSIVRGGVVDKTVAHAKKTPSISTVLLSKDLGELQALLEHVEASLTSIKTNKEYEAVHAEIDTIKYHIDLLKACPKELERRNVVRLQAKRYQEQELRFKELSQLFYDTFMGDLRPVGGPRAAAHPDYIFHARPYIKKLAIEGGERYNHALSAIRFAYTGETASEQEKAYKDALFSVIPPLK